MIHWWPWFERARPAIHGNVKFRMVTTRARLSTRRRPRSNLAKGIVPRGTDSLDGSIKCSENTGGDQNGPANHRAEVRAVRAPLPVRLHENACISSMFAGPFRSSHGFSECLLDGMKGRAGFGVILLTIFSSRAREHDRAHSPDVKVCEVARAESGGCADRPKRPRGRHGPHSRGRHA